MIVTHTCVWVGLILRSLCAQGFRFRQRVKSCSVPSVDQDGQAWSIQRVGVSEAPRGPRARDSHG